MNVSVYDPTPCTLGEGPLWHPGLNCLFWFDIVGKRMYQRQGDTTRQWQFDDYVSAAGWIDDDNLLIASATRLFQFTLSTGDEKTITPLEADTPTTRSNDGRADPWGGFWIGTMNVDGSREGGAIYRFYKGELRQLYAPISTPNAMCFALDGTHAYFTDTPTRIVQKVALDDDGWPAADPEPFLDLNDQGLKPDGAVIDADGNLWLACWGAAQVICFAPDGRQIRAIDLPAAQTTCPAFGGPDMQTLFCTSAARDDDGPAAGQTFAVPAPTKGRAEPQIKL
ncbi:SMP-30/gluconolactonase/LRE family protein [Oceaniglobus ichthyenteri]|uniref:SMP-30/gluconolactonase/LRE family protein n=1 Tax=Oceaniglobus ichthyenteri TaxID=2136177 RepID=UPI000D36B980|nr:SMP-30/gluconolactonase/LRE family protein [Oceaniglobus ichthyenteri]